MIRILYTHSPGIAFLCLWSGYAYVTAYGNQIVSGYAFDCFLHCISFCDGTYIQFHLVIGQKNCILFLINKQLGNIRMLHGVFQCISIRKLGCFRIFYGFCACFVPYVQHAAQSDVYRTLCQFGFLFAQQQQIQNLSIHHNRLFSRQFIDSLQIDNALVIIVDIKKLMIRHKRLMNLLCLLLKCLFRLFPADNGSNRVKHIQIGYCILFFLIRLCR